MNLNFDNFLVIFLSHEHDGLVLRLSILNYECMSKHISHPKLITIKYVRKLL